VEIGVGVGFEDLGAVDWVGVLDLGAVSLIVGLGRGATLARPGAFVRDGAAGGARVFKVVVHALDTSERSVDARFVDFANLCNQG
jgi:hypothetical protein